MHRPKNRFLALQAPAENLLPVIEDLQVFFI